MEHIIHRLPKPIAKTSSHAVKICKKSELNLISLDELKSHLKEIQPQQKEFKPFASSALPTKPLTLSAPKQKAEIPLDVLKKITGVYGYKSPNDANQCGPASMSTVIDFSGIFWPDIPRQANGHFDNDVFVQRVMDFSGTPDTPFGLLGTTPMRIQEKLNGLCGRRSGWYGNGTAEDTCWNIKNEIDAGRPVIILVDYGQIGHPFIMDWQVAFGYDDNGVYCKISSGIDVDFYWDLPTFHTVMQNNLPGWNRSYITFG